MTDHCPGPVYQQRPQVPIASLANPQQHLFTASSVLARDNSERCGDLSPVAIARRISDARHVGRGADRPDAALASFAFRAVRPTFDGEPFTLCGKPSDDGKTIELWAKDRDGWLTMQATATLA